MNPDFGEHRKASKQAEEKSGRPAMREWIISWLVCLNSSLFEYASQQEDHPSTEYLENDGLSAVPSIPTDALPLHPRRRVASLYRYALHRSMHRSSDKPLQLFALL